MADKTCPFCGEGKLTSLDGIIALQKKHDVWDGKGADHTYFCGTTRKYKSPKFNQSETCKLRVMLNDPTPLHIQMDVQKLNNVANGVLHANA